MATDDVHVVGPLVVRGSHVEDVDLSAALTEERVRERDRKVRKWRQVCRNKDSANTGHLVGRERLIVRHRDHGDRSAAVM
jgi:hypothetical protein